MKFANVLIVGLLGALTTPLTVQAQVRAGDATSPDDSSGPTPATKPEVDEFGEPLKPTPKKTQPASVPATQPSAVNNQDAGADQPPAGADALPQGGLDAPVPAKKTRKGSVPNKTLETPDLKLDAPGSQDGESVPMDAPAKPMDTVKPNADPLTKPARPKGPALTKPLNPAATGVKDPTAADLTDDLRGNPNTSTNANRARNRVRTSDVGLSPEQTNAIIEIRKSSQIEAERRLTEELRLSKLDMNAAMMDATPAEEVRRKFELVQRKYLELQRIKFDRTLKIREVLSIDQRKKLQGIKNSH